MIQGEFKLRDTDHVVKIAGKVCYITHQINGTIFGRTKSGRLIQFNTRTNELVFRSKLGQFRKVKLAV